MPPGPVSNERAAELRVLQGVLLGLAAETLAALRDHAPRPTLVALRERWDVLKAQLDTDATKVASLYDIHAYCTLLVELGEWDAWCVNNGHAIGTPPPSDPGVPPARC